MGELKCIRSINGNLSVFAVRRSLRSGDFVVVYQWENLSVFALTGMFRCHDSLKHICTNIKPIIGKIALATNFACGHVQ